MSKVEIFIPESKVEVHTQVGEDSITLTGRVNSVSVSKDSITYNIKHLDYRGESTLISPFSTKTSTIILKE